MGCDHLDDLFLLRERRLEMRRRREMPSPALPLRQRLVGDVADEILEEAVLPVLGRAWVGLDAEHLLPDE